MKAVVFHDIGDIRLDEVQDPKIQDPADAIVRLTASAIRGTDLHFVRGTRSTRGLQAGSCSGHSGSPFRGRSPRHGRPSHAYRGACPWLRH